MPKNIDNNLRINSEADDPEINLQSVIRTNLLEFDNPVLANELFGPRNSNLDILSQVSGISLSSRGAKLYMTGEDEAAKSVLANLVLQLYDLLKKGVPVKKYNLKTAWDMLNNDPGLNISQVFKDAVFVHTPQKTVTARNMAQKKYLDALQTNELVFAVGPAGTGKTYLAVAMSIALLQKQKIKKIILTRPAVEAGERLGFLPGDLAEKINPYLRPLYDALYDMVPQPKVAAMLETGVIEIAPLAFMRGRTLNNAFIILDEAQNTTQEQMKMFLTRMGFGSRMVVTGDITQIDLPVQAGFQKPRSGLIHALEVLKNVPGMAIHQFGKADVVRHPLVGAIVNAYDKSEKNSFES